MLWTMAIALALISAYIEFKLVARIRPVRWLFEKSWLAGFILSMCLSLLLGWLFGLSGLVAGMAGLGSTMLTDPVHALNRRAKNKNDEISQFIRDFKDTYRPMLKVVKWGVIVALAPLWVPVKIRSYIRSAGVSP